MSVFVTDTHPVIWYILNKHSALSSKVLKAFQSAEAGQAYIYVPAVVLWEIAMLENTGKIRLDGGFEKWAKNLLNNRSFGVAPLELEIIALGTGFNINGDLFDEMIVAYAAHLDLPLITKDYAITKSKLVEIYW